MIGNSLWNKLFGLGKVKEEIIKPSEDSLRVEVSFYKNSHRYASVATYVTVVNITEEWFMILPLPRKLFPEPIVRVTNLLDTAWRSTNNSRSLAVSRRCFFEDKIPTLVEGVEEILSKAEIPYTISTESGSTKVTFRVPSQGSHQWLPIHT